MEISLYPDADAAYISIQASKCHHSHEVNDATFVDLDNDGNTLSVQFRYVSNGVDHQQLTGLTDQETQQVFSLLQGSGIKVTPSG